MSPLAPAPSFRVLVVCTGNVCRSPAAELLLRAGLGDDAKIQVSSAGLEALVGQPVAAPMARLLRGRTIDPADFVARQLQWHEVGAADLVLTMTVAQRSAVVSRAPVVLRRAFTLREFADLVRLADAGGTRSDAGAPAERLRALLREVPRARGGRPAGPQWDDIEDPYGRGDRVFARVLRQIADAVDGLLGVLEPVVDHAG
jgi:protein-tyrosine phosphatase